MSQFLDRPNKLICTPYHKRREGAIRRGRGRQEGRRCTKERATQEEDGCATVSFFLSFFLSFLGIYSCTFLCFVYSLCLSETTTSELLINPISRTLWYLFPEVRGVAALVGEEREKLRQRGLTKENSLSPTREGKSPWLCGLAEKKYELGGNTCQVLCRG